ncbi:MAG: tRNA glutamyl-Q(34) synthetase GluQRS [Pseudomonadota bacterium]
MSSPNGSSGTGTTVTASTYRGRFAPSPTGPLHAGSLVAALASYLDARSVGGEWLVRIEDIDPPREIAGASDDILRTLEALELTWDGSVRRQSQRHEHYASVAQRLYRDGKAFYCRCSRQQLRDANAALGRVGGYYPGTCRSLGHRDGALRVYVSDAEIAVDDRLQAALVARLDNECGDFVIYRRDGLPAYQLAVTLDDADQGITDIVRGVDLYDSTPRQVWLQRLLGLPTPRYAHFPILTDAEGRKLAKQTGAPAIDASEPGPLLYQALKTLRQEPPAELAAATASEVLAWGTAHWQAVALRRTATLPSSSVAPQQNPVRF